MPIRYRCPTCNQLLSIATRRAGAELPCPRCGDVSRVPPTSEAAPGEVPDVAPAETRPAAEPVAEVASVAESSRSELAREPVAPDESDEEERPVVFRRKPMAAEELDMTPMVDMTFLLLIFFMVTATFSQQKTLQIPPPDSDRKGARQSTEMVEDVLDASLRIEIDAANTVTIEEQKVVQLAELGDRVRELMRSQQKTEAMLMIDRRAFHETVVMVVDACNEAGIQRIRLAGEASAGGVAPAKPR